MYQYIIKYYRKLKALQIKGRHPRRLVREEMEAMEEVMCKNCGTEFKGEFCPNCGQKGRVGRLRIRQGVEDLVGIFTNFDTGFMHTCLELIYRPGYMMYDYIKGHRKEYVKPIQLLFLLASIAMFEHLFLFGDFETSDANFSLDPETFEGDKKLEMFVESVLATMHECFNWILANKAVMYMLIVSFLVLPNRLCFMKTEIGKGMNISEHFFVMIYAGCQFMMLSILQMPMERFITDYESGMGFSFLVLLWDFCQLFRASTRKTVLLTLISCFLAFLFFVLILIAGTFAGFAYYRLAN